MGVSRNERGPHLRGALRRSYIAARCAAPTMILDIISWVLLVGGSFFLIVGAVGLVRLPDFFTRLHAAGVTDTGGAGLILVGLMFQSGLSLVTVKLFITLLFILFTSPTACHALAKAAVHAGLLNAESGRDSQNRAYIGDGGGASGEPR